MSTDREMRAVSGRIEALVAEIDVIADPVARGRIEELVRLLMHLHGEGLARMLAILRGSGVEADRVVEQFAADPVVASVLMLHDAHPHDVPTRVERALDLLRRGLGATVTLSCLAASDERVHIRIEADAGGCGSPIDGIKAAVEAAIRDAAPDVGDVAVDAAALAPASPLIQLTRR